eukprot:IDg21688t1
MLGSIDICKGKGKNCPAALHGQYHRKEGVPTVTLEAIADDRLYIWHIFFGMSRCNNDINVVEASTLRNKIANGEYPSAVEYRPGGGGMHDAVLVGRWNIPEDSERAFRVLQGKLYILSRRSRFWYKDDMQAVMNTCVILRNIMVNEREGLEEGIGGASVAGVHRVSTYVRAGEEGMALCRLCTFLGDAAQYQRTRDLVMKHLWMEEGS